MGYKEKEKITKEYMLHCDDMTAKTNKLLALLNNGHMIPEEAARSDFEKDICKMLEEMRMEHQNYKRDYYAKMKTAK